MNWQSISTAPKDMASYLFLCNGVVVQGFRDATGALCVCDWQKAVEEFAALCCEAEREECAKVCEEVFSSTGRTFDHRAVAAAIRARGKP